MEQFNRVWILTRTISPLILAIITAVLLTTVIPYQADGQITSATIVGTLTDPDGGQVPNAQVTAKNIDTGLTRTVVTGEDGTYRIEFLPVGNYSLEIKASTGFKKAFRNDVVLQVNEIIRVDFTLEIGQVNETVTITDETPQINTSSVELGRTVQTREIENLPLVERNVFALLDLTPGVQSNNTGVATASASTADNVLGFPEQRTIINGGTDGGTGSVNYYLDGGNNMTNLRNTGNSLPNPDAIQEFRVQTNSYNAEFGRFASGVINVLTKSGTNKFHGSLFEYVRNEAFNANDWGSQLDKAPFRRNQFGGTIGGPVIRDKTFFFFSYSGLRQKTSKFLNNAIVPSALERIGDFSESAIMPRDPATVAPGGALNSGAVFSCNGVLGVICPDRLDPVALKIINDYIPLPNLPGNRWQGNVATPYNSDEFLVKVDHQMNEPHRLTFTYFTTAGVSTVFPGSGNLPWATQDYKWRQHNVNLSDVWIITPDKINQIWLTYTRNFGGRLNLPATSLTDLGSSFTGQGAPSLPQIVVTGFFSLTNAIGGPVAGTNFYAIRNVFSWNKGKHSLKLGGEISLNKDIQETLLNNYGVYTFNNAATRNALAAFLLGVPSRITQDAPIAAYSNSWYTAVFIQDDFRATSRLTLNLGLRWDVQTPPTDPLNRFVNYIPGQQSTVNPAAPTGLLFYGDAGVERGGIPIGYDNISPRIGAAWDPFGDGKTSIRAAAGIFYGSMSGNEWNTMTNYQPWSTRLTFTNINQRMSADGTALGATLSDPYNNYAGGNPFPYDGSFTDGGGAFAVATDFDSPYTVQSNISIQRQISKQLTVGAAFVGNLSRRLPFSRDVNYPVLTSTATNSGSNIQARRPNQDFGAVMVLDSDQKASYKGLQLTSAMRFNKFFTFNAFYTLSKTLSSVQLHNNTTLGLAQNYSDLYQEKGAADTDQRHVFSMNMNFQPDFYKGGNKIVSFIANGWRISPIIKLRSGRPFTVTNGGVDANLDGVATDRAQLIGDPYLANPTPDMWFNTAAFAQNQIVTGIATDGNSLRNFLYGPGYRVVDLALSRDFRLTEKVKLRLRAEGTNVFNIVNYGQPGSAVPSGTTSTTFGVIRSASAMRRMQFGMRLTF